MDSPQISGQMDNATLWRIINKYFEDTPQYLVSHHLESYNDFFHKGIHEVFKNKNPIQIVSGYESNPLIKGHRHKCNMYLGGLDGSKVYFGKPMIHDKDNSHYMYPNEARLRNMTYAMTVHYDVVVEFIDTFLPGEETYPIGKEFLTPEEIRELGRPEQTDADDTYNYPTEPNFALPTYPDGIPPDANLGTDIDYEQVLRSRMNHPVDTQTTAAMADAMKRAHEKSISVAENGVIVQKRMLILKNIYLGRIPIMVQSDFCILAGMPRQMRHSFGECRNDPGGYFIIGGKEKTIAVQEKFGDNMLYIRKGRSKKDEEGEEELTDDYLFSAEIRSVSENVAKPMRTMAVKLLAPTVSYTNRNIVVNVPNVRAPVPLFILFRALGITSDREIISMCLLDIDQYDYMVDLFEPSIHDAGPIMQQQLALDYIGELTKFHSKKYAMEILTDYFLPHVGETNFKEKAYFLGNMVFRLLSASLGLEPETDRDNLKYKRLEPFGVLFNDLFREYYTIQQKYILQMFDSKIYYNKSIYEHNLPSLIFNNYRDIFGERIVDKGISQAFRGNWGAEAHTKRIGVVQDLNRISFNATIAHLRKINLPLDSTSKVVGPRILHNTHWGYFDFIDTPDGANIGLHKTFAMSAYITRGYSRENIIRWMRQYVDLHPLGDYTPFVVSTKTKVFVNGYWAGVVAEPFECVEKMRLYRRNGLIPLHTSVAFDVHRNTVEVFTDAGRFCRPIFYKDPVSNRLSFMQSKDIIRMIERGEFTWEQLVSGINKKRESAKYSINDVKIRRLCDLYENVNDETKTPTDYDRFLTEKAVVEYIDPNETEHSLIAQNLKDWEQNRDKQARYTHMEVHHSFLFGTMCNQAIFAENNPAARISFSCSQSRQACSVYHSNFQNRMDKTAVVLNYGQIPLLKTRLLEHIDREEHPYGENVIVAIMCYTGYNVEDAILVNEGSLQRGLFNTTYYTTYTEHEERKKGQMEETIVDKRFMNIESAPNVVNLKPGHDYSKLDENGLIRENTPVDDKTILIGYTSNNVDRPQVRVDHSKTTKKGQLGVVDKAFITEGEEGERIAKVRIREIRQPNIGDKMASRAGQKGVVGLVIREKDMPFTKNGIRPDLIINPHALPTRQTIGHLVECLIGKVCTMYGGFSDCTAFNNEGSKAAQYGRLLPAVGFHSSGHEILYNGMTGEQIESEIFVGPNYYMRLKHMVKDKINYRALGPRTALTKQPVSGRANDGGLRIGEMERDALLGHGISDFLRESMMERGDKYQMVVCNTTGLLAVYNKERDLFMSPMADGPVRFFKSDTAAGGFVMDTMTKYGRKFSVVSVPYSLKLLMQELAAINVQLRIITEDNLTQIESIGNMENLDTAKTNHANIMDILGKPIKEPIRKGGADKLPEHQEQKQEQEPEQEPEQQTGLPKPELPRVGMYEDAGSNIDSMDLYEGSRTRVESDEMPTQTYEYNDDDDPMNKFKLGEQVYYVGSSSLGLLPKTPWTIIKKGGKFITIDAEPNNTSATKREDFLQIVKPDTLAKIDEFNNWEADSAYNMGANEMMVQPNMMTPNMMMQGGATTQPMQTPAIKFAPVIKVITGDDNSHNIGGESIPIDPIAQQQMQPQNGIDFSAPVISATGPSSSADESPKPEEKPASEQSGGGGESLLGKISSFVINKL